MKGKLYSLLMLGLLLTLSSGFAADKTSKSERDRSTTSESRSHAKKIDVNTADQATLETLPGVGPVIAQEIIAHRPYKSVEDLKKVNGIGDVRYAQIKDQVTVHGRSASTAAAGSSTRGSDKESNRPQRSIDQPAKASGAPAGSATSTRGSDKESNRPQRSVDQPAKADSSTPRSSGSSTRGSDKESNRPQREIDQPARP
jgi:competence ComEA-like helix-hairpin-helix protein